MEYILGVLASLLVEWIKKSTNLGGWKTLAVLALISFVAAAVYTYAVDIGIWQSIAQIIITAGAFYAFILKRF